MAPLMENGLTLSQCSPIFLSLLLMNTEAEFNLLFIYYVSGTVLGTGEMPRVNCFQGAFIPVREREPVTNKILSHGISTRWRTKVDWCNTVSR